MTGSAYFCRRLFPLIAH